ncbi:MAG: hypothetical protein K0R57_3058 [Paenibacillaceae bacterium]|jgi:GT2 family glycosyltransferase|nr:hypothetical protein [Paenibacillaceae bacterium]
MLTSIVILTHNQLPLTHGCLESIRRHTADYELIVVDNGSTDGTVAYLRSQSDIIVHENNENLGFAKGCNQGFALSRGENVLFLNNDTIVTEHWLDNMLRVLHENERVGMTGPLTNYSSGHQRIPASYGSIAELDAFARRHCEDNAGCYMDVRRLVGFCLLVKRKLLREIGGFDERFGLGNYEDDDLCLRALQAGYLLRIANDSYIHHIGHATMNSLQDFNLTSLLAHNRLKATEKWGGDIHQIIYRQEAAVSLCLVASNAGSVLEQTLVSVTDDVDEIVIVDLGSTDNTAEIAHRYDARVFSYRAQEDITDAYRLAFDKATKDYLFWLNPGEILNSAGLKRLSSLKFSLDGGQDMVLLSHDIGPGRRFLYRRAAGFRQEDDL